MVSLWNTGCSFLCVGTAFSSNWFLGTIVTNIITNSARQAICSTESERSQHSVSNYAQNCAQPQSTVSSIVKYNLQLTFNSLICCANKVPYSHLVLLFVDLKKRSFFNMGSYCSCTAQPCNITEKENLCPSFNLLRLCRMEKILVTR